MPIEIAGHLTVADHVKNGTLNDPIGYVRGILENMTACKKQHGDAIVTTGNTGKGIAPHYRIAPDRCMARRQIVASARSPPS